ncbi:hypothetical protein J2W83_003409 [Pseudomonas hunanensis]|uniref:Uncharacterized protein n=1 Tax=Pseudomonas hunanensis TaxID=1247546 RepID=A0ACC6K5R0_9PSED|nr:hypothetical protein [Pseudomonas sp. BP8]MDR6713794.1 hypothetical protein [Pseudomonas hunanensis]
MSTPLNVVALSGGTGRCPRLTTRCAKAPEARP